MNIAFISYWSCPLTRIGVMSGGGMSVYLVNLANHLGESGHRIDIYTRAHKENDEKILLVHKNVRVIHLRQTSKDLYQDVEFFCEKTIRFIRKNNLNYDILHAHYFYSGLVGRKLKKILEIPLFSTFHSLAIPKEVYAGIKDARRIRNEKIIINEADGIIASTEVERQDLVLLYQACKKKIFVVPPGVNHNLFKKRNSKLARKKINLPQNKKILLFIGRIDPIKNISVLIRALSILHDDYSQFKHDVLNILIGGDIRSHHFWKQTEVIKISRLINENNVSCCVRFIGNKPMYVLPYYYSAADLVILPSIYESFGLVILEAMACGKAVVASRVGGLKYLVKDRYNGRLFESGNANQLAKIIWELVNDVNQRKKLGERAYSFSQAFCWEKQAKKIIKIYKKYL